jgi:hypothetical protein
MEKPVFERRVEHQRRWAALEQERSSWIPHYRELSRFLLPRSGRYFSQDRNRGESRINNIYDSTPTKALRTLGAGMMGGQTSPARPWFKLATPDQDLNRYGAVKIWLDDTARIMRDVFSRSNTYRTLHTMYEELGAFGTAVSIVVEDYKNVIHHYPLTAGEYAIATDYRGSVCTLYRQLDKTVAQVVEEFGIENCSLAVKNLYDRNDLDKWITIIHAIEPRLDRDSTSRLAQDMPWKSVYFELGGDPDMLLREGGFKSFSVLAPRWSVTGGDIYGHSPGMEALGDIKQLQHEQLRKAQAIDYMTKPPLQAPTVLKGTAVDTLPGGITYFDSASNGIRPQFEVRLDLNHLLADIQDVRQRIFSAFHADLFLMLDNQRDARMTATEVAERHEEKLLMLGPVLERLHNEMLDPLIEITFDAMLHAGIIPPPPSELKNVDMNVEYVSMLAQAQRAIGTNSVDRFVSNLGMIAQMKPNILDKFDSDEWAEAYSDMLGVDPNLIVPNDKVGIVRKSREQAQQQAQQAQIDQVRSQTAANMAKAAPSQNPIDMFSGYNA